MFRFSTSDYPVDRELVCKKTFQVGDDIIFKNEVALINYDYYGDLYLQIKRGEKKYKYSYVIGRSASTFFYVEKELDCLELLYMSYSDPSKHWDLVP